MERFETVVTGYTFRLTIVAQERRVHDDAVEGALQLRRQLQSFLKVVQYKLLEDVEPLVNLKQLDLRSALVFA